MIIAVVTFNIDKELTGAYLKKYLPIKVIDKKENFRRIIDI